MDDHSNSFPLGPLSHEDVKKIDLVSLPILKKHHLRLLAHCLACLKLIGGKEIKGHFPSESSILAWCSIQPALQREEAFIPIFLEQLELAASHLENLANELKVTPMELTIDDLIACALTSSGFPSILPQPGVQS